MGIPEDKLNMTFYKGEDIYSDGDIEDEILNELQKNEDVMEILRNHNEWPFLYHLSPIRENLLEWYNFNPEGTCLEIGSGCGAISGILCNKLKRVVGIDLSRKRSLINATKNKKYDNLEIMVGNFEDIKIDEKFDYVTLIGVLEYSIYYINGEKPFETMLERVKSFLKPEGVLIIAIENKYGMKYFAGATEDHTGNHFDGIQNYHGVERVRTFSRSKLEELLNKSGFARNEFYYPVPDYKLPNTIYSDDYLPDKGSIRNTMTSYDRDRYEFFDEGLAFDSVCEDNLFKEFSNSFLVFSSQK